MGRVRVASAMSLLLAVFVLLSGCDGLLNNEYRRITPHLDQVSQSEDQIEWRASDLAGLKRALLNLIERHGDTIRIKLNQYTTSVGTIDDEIVRAGYDVKKDNHIAAYTVDYISKEYLPPYNEVVYTVYYLKGRNKPEKEASSLADLTDLIEEAMENNTSKLALSISNEVIASADLSALLRTAYYRAPSKAVGMPTITYSLYPDQGDMRVVELAIAYPYSNKEFQARIKEVGIERDALLSRLPDGLDPPHRALELFNLLCANLEFDPRAQSGEDGDAQDNLFSALVEKKAASAGYAMAFTQLCAGAEIECRLVIGMRANKVHFWTIVLLDGDWYHVDVAADAQAGNTHEWFLATDSEMSEFAFWDTGKTPRCYSNKHSYAELAGGPDYDDPTASPDPDDFSPEETADADGSHD